MSRVARPFVVLDTNVLVSGFVNPYGAPAVILRLAVRGQIRLVYDVRIFAEYTEVLLRPTFRLAETCCARCLICCVSRAWAL
ncbi:PIN domain-containing protein [Kyrpidia tusciae]|uniref:PIN domain-containing protein n=1 Tax=Kyrpidia tusciae TaxID=33943 RepID=UPI000A009231